MIHQSWFQDEDLKEFVLKFLGMLTCKIDKTHLLALVKGSVGEPNGNGKQPGTTAVIHSVNFVFGIFPVLKEQRV